MAESPPINLEQELIGIKQLLWGNDIKRDIFKRWSQGFYFSKSEPSALEQLEGGPCAVIAPVQAFILKNLMNENNSIEIRDLEINTSIQNRLLVDAFCEILDQCSNNNQRYYIVSINNSDKSSLNGDNSRQQRNIDDNNCVVDNDDNHDFLQIDPIKFHTNLKITIFNHLDDAKKYYFDSIDMMRTQYGILLFLYSVIATRGLEVVQMDNTNDISDPLIDDTYGYGSQSLINLMITGRATPYVWDHEQDVGGLKLKGLEKQSQIGFITIMEHLRYCTVGSFYKNPINPVWVLGSDTHLTVLFSYERRLVSPETKTEQARRVFKNYDPDGNNFINSDLLQNVLKDLDLVSEEAYVKIMKIKLDPERLGIILLNNFMDEFFPKEETSMPDTFIILHYNGLTQSNINGQIKYRIGDCILLESDLKAVCESNPMLTVLQTKWPNIEVRWIDNITPSLN